MSAINLSTIPMNIPTLCIPRVFPNITEPRIQKIFGDLKLGEIERIDIVPKTAENGDKYNRVFVHFKRWFNTSPTDEVRGRLLNGKDIKIIYDEPWFWKVSAYRPPAKDKNPPKTRAHQSQRATIELEPEPETYTLNKEEFEYQYRPSCAIRPPTRFGITRMESGSEAWTGVEYQRPENNIRPRKFTQNRPKTSNFAKPKAQRPTTINVTNTIEKELEEGELEN